MWKYRIVFCYCIAWVKPSAAWWTQKPAFDLCNFTGDSAPSTDRHWKSHRILGPETKKATREGKGTTEQGKEHEDDLQQSSNSVLNQEIKWYKHGVNQGVWSSFTGFSCLTLSNSMEISAGNWSNPSATHRAHLNSTGASKACTDLGPQVFSPTWTVTQELRTQLRQSCRWLLWNKPSAKCRTWAPTPQSERLQSPAHTVQVKWWRTPSVQHHPFTIISVKSHCKSNHSFTYCFYSSKVLSLPPHHFSLACALRHFGFFKKNTSYCQLSPLTPSWKQSVPAVQLCGSVTLESFFLAMGFF